MHPMTMVMGHGSSYKPVIIYSKRIELPFGFNRFGAESTDSWMISFYLAQKLKMISIQS